MKTFWRWGLVVAGLAVLVGIIYNIFFHLWPFYPMWGWRFHYFGPKIWPIFPFFGMLMLILGGILILNSIFRPKGATVSKERRRSFFPFWGSDLKASLANTRGIASGRSF